MPDPRRGYPHRSSIPISIYAKLFAEAIVFSIDEIVGERQRKGSLIVNAAWHSIIRKLIDYVGKANERLKWNCEGKFCINIVILVDELKRDFDNWKKKKKRIKFQGCVFIHQTLLVLYFYFYILYTYEHISFPMFALGKL